MRRTRAQRSESGAVAVLVGLLAVVLFGMAAFTTDFGMAYVSKRQLQTASDAAALAAASVYTQYPGDCATLASNGTAEAAAQAAADSVREENRPSSDGADLVLECPADGTLAVTYTSQGETDVFLGGILGFTDSVITTSREATASVAVPESIGNMRPYMICSNDVPSGSSPSSVVKVRFPGTANSTGPCPTADNPGNWWTVNCPEDSSNSTAVLVENTRNGCEASVSTVDPQPPAEESPPNTALRNALVAGCSGGPDQDCLNAVTGNISSAGIWDAWESLLGKSIVLPSFCGDEICSPAAVSPASGNNVDYPVYKFVGVTVCGYHWGSGDQKTGQTDDGVCANNPESHDASDGDNDDKYLLLVFSQVQLSGTTNTSACAVGSGCDGGLRIVLLTN
jgi:Flp pilus assembly protein TadG